MKDEQVTLRLPGDVARLLEAQASERGVSKSQVVREALQAYLAAVPPSNAAAIWQRVAPFVGSVALDSAASERDALARQIRAHNWRS